MALPSVDSRPIRTVNGFSSRWNAAHLPLIYTISNTKWPLNSEDTGNFILSYFDTNGYASLVMFTAYTWYEGLYLKITNNSDYNGTYRIRSVVSSTIVVLDTAYISGAATNGYAYPVYSNYTTIVRVYAGLQPTHDHYATKPIELIGTIEQRPDTDNNTIIDVAKYVRTKLSAEYDDSQSSWPNDLNAFTDFYISYAERYDQSSSGSIIDYTSAYTDDAVGGSIYYLHAVNSSLQLGYPHGGNMGDYIIDPDTYKNVGEWMTFFTRPQIVDGSRISLGIIANYTPFSIKTIATEPDGTTEEVTTLISDQDYGVYRIDNDVIQAGQFTETVSVVALIGGVEASETIIIDVDNQCIDFPEEPSGLTLGNATSTTLTATWFDNSTTETGFQVQISLYSDFSSITESATVGEGVTSYIFSGLSEGTIYYSRVRALGEVNSEWSDTASAGTIYDFLNGIAGDGINDYMQNTLTSYSLPDEFTIEMWIKPDFIASRYETIFQTDGTNQNSLLLYKDNDSGSNNLIWYARWNPTGFNIPGSSEGGSIVLDAQSTDKIYCVLSRSKSGPTYSYRGGFAKVGQAFTGSPRNNLDAFSLDTTNVLDTFTFIKLLQDHGGSNYSKTQIGDFRLWADFFTADERLESYNDGNGTSPNTFINAGKTLVIQAKMDSESGAPPTSTPDSSGNGYDFTLINYAASQLSTF